MPKGHGNKRSGWLLILIVVISVGPGVLALVLFKNPGWVSGRINYGHLIEPAVLVKRTDFTGLDEFSRKNIDELRGHWVLVHIVTEMGCKSGCKESLHKTKQLRLLLNKDLMRVRRMAVVVDEVTDEETTTWWQGHDYLLRARSTARVLDIAQKVAGGTIPEGSVFIMDPMGHIMMWYEPGFDPYGMKKDLKRLLYVSRVG